MTAEQRPIELEILDIDSVPTNINQCFNTIILVITVDTAVCCDRVCEQISPHFVNIVGLNTPVELCIVFYSISILSHIHLLSYAASSVKLHTVCARQQ